MDKQEVLMELREQVHTVVLYLEEHCDYEQLCEDGLFSMLYTRYRNALSVLREEAPGYSVLRKALQFLTSATRAYVDSSVSWEDPLREEMHRCDKLVDTYLRADKEG